MKAVRSLRRGDSAKNEKGRSSCYALRVTKDEKYCLTGGQDRVVRLYNPRKDQEEHSPRPRTAGAAAALLIKEYSGPHGYEILDLAISGDNGKFASCGGDRSAFVWDVSSGSVIRRVQGHFSTINAIAANEEFTVLVTGSYDQSIKAWDLRAPGRLPIQELEGCTDSVTSVIIQEQDSDGKSGGRGGAIIAGCIDGKVRTFDLRAGRLHEDDFHAPITCVSSSRDGASLLVSCLGASRQGRKPSLRLLDAHKGSELESSPLQGHANDKYSIRNCFARQDSQACCGSEDGAVYLWSLATSEIVQRTQAHSKPVSAVQWTHDDLMITASHDGTATVWCPKSTQ